MNSSSTTAASEPSITPEILRDHGITPEEYDKILKSLGRTPTLTELGIFSVMWSEHCSYKSSRVHLKRLPTRSRSSCKDRARTRASSTSATAGRAPSRSSRTTIRRLSSPFRARPPVSAASCATSSPWARVRSPSWTRCGLGRSQSALVPTDGKDGAPTVDQADLAQEPLDDGRCCQRRGVLRELFRRAESRWRRRSSSPATRAIRW